MSRAKPLISEQLHSTLTRMPTMTITTTNTMVMTTMTMTTSRTLIVTKLPASRRILLRKDDEGSQRSGLHDGKICAAAVGAIFIIGACGIFGVLVIPMNRKIYQHSVQFLITLAVGTLAGDAHLHLLPNAIMGPHHHHATKEKSHMRTIMKALDLHNRTVWIGTETQSINHIRIKMRS